MQIGIIGYGEVGSSLEKIYKNTEYKVNLYDPYKNLLGDLSNSVVINVCIPCKTTEKFVEDVKKILLNCDKCKLVIIHSSILLDVMKIMTKYFPLLKIVHSPVRGVHPNLDKGLRTFVKFIGHAENDSEAGEMAKSHLESLGIMTKVTTYTTTILAKLLSTTYYGMCIAFTEDMGKICDKENINMETINLWTKTYNEGYEKLGMSNVRRPVLFRIPDGKHIGGHCVIPNAELLKSMYPDINAWDYVLKYK